VVLPIPLSYDRPSAVTGEGGRGNLTTKQLMLITLSLSNCLHSHHGIKEKKKGGCFLRKGSMRCIAHDFLFYSYIRLLRYRRGKEEKGLGSTRYVGNFFLRMEKGGREGKEKRGHRGSRWRDRNAPD